MTEKVYRFTQGEYIAMILSIIFGTIIFFSIILMNTIFKRIWKGYQQHSQTQQEEEIIEDQEITVVNE